MKRKTKRHAFGSLPEEHSRRATMYFKAAPGYLKMTMDRLRTEQCDAALSSLVGFHELIARGVSHLDSGGKSNEPWDQAVDHVAPRVREEFRRVCMRRRR